MTLNELGFLIVLSLVVQSLVVWRLGSVEQRLRDLISTEGSSTMAFADALAALQAEVERNTSVDQSAVALLEGLSQQLADAIAANDPAAIQAFADALRTSTDSLAAAVAANTPGA